MLVRTTVFSILMLSLFVFVVNAQSVTYTGLIDAYYSYNFAGPSSNTNALRNFDVNSKSRAWSVAGAARAPTLSMYHDRIREVVVGSLDEATSRKLHVQLAQAVEQWERERTDMLARFWLSADDHERAKRYACEAAAEARTKLAFDRAAQLYQTAAALETDDAACAELYRALGDCQASNGCAVAAAEAYQQAAERSHPTQASRLRHLAAEQLLRGGEIARGMAVLTQVLKEAGLALAPGPRRAALSVAWRLVRLRLRGVGFVERPASSISAEDNTCSTCCGRRHRSRRRRHPSRRRFSPALPDAGSQDRRYSAGGARVCDTGGSVGSSRRRAFWLGHASRVRGRGAGAALVGFGHHRRGPHVQGHRALLRRRV